MCFLIALRKQSEIFNSTLDEDKAEKSEQIGATRNSVSFGERKGLIGRQEERY